MIDYNPQTYDDLARQKKTEKMLKEKRKPWYFRRYWYRNLLEWLNVYIGCAIIIMTLHKNTWAINDLLLMTCAGVNISMWLLAGIINRQRDSVEDLIKLNIQSINLIKETLEERNEI
jgi:hypothetical protein